MSGVANEATESRRRDSHSAREALRPVLRCPRGVKKGVERYERGSGRSRSGRVEGVNSSSSVESVYRSSSSSRRIDGLDSSRRRVEGVHSSSSVESVHRSSSSSRRN